MFDYQSAHMLQKSTRRGFIQFCFEGAHLPFREKHGGVVTNHVVGYVCESKLRDTM